MTAIRLSAFVALTLCTMCSAKADIIDFRVDSGTLGSSLDGIDAVINGITVPGFQSLTIDVTALSSNVAGSVTLNGLTSGTRRFGIDLGEKTIGDGDDTDQFDAIFEESVSFRFNQEVTINSIDFVNFENGEQFEVAGTSFFFSDFAMITSPQVVQSGRLL